MVRLKLNSFYKEKMVTACVKFSDENIFFVKRFDDFPPSGLCSGY